MEQSADYRERLTAAVQVDRLFNTFEIEMMPPEALSFAEMAPAAGIADLPSLLERINKFIPVTNFGPEHRQTGRAHHHYRIGRESGQRMVKIEIFKGYFQEGFDFMGMLEIVHSFGTHAGAKVKIDMDNNSYSIVMRWPGGNL